MTGFTVNSRVVIRVELDTPKDGATAWERDFNDESGLEKFLSSVTPPTEAAKIAKFISQTKSFRVAHENFASAIEDFGKFEFKKLPKG
jgi:hypothetical protein